MSRRSRGRCREAPCAVDPRGAGRRGDPRAGGARGRAGRGQLVASNLGSLAREYAGELYTGIVAVFSLVFLMNRRFAELLVFFCAAIVVGWFVFAPGQVADAAKAIAHQVLP